MDWKDYALKDIEKSLSLNKILEDISTKSSYDITIANPYSNSRINIKENGNIEMYVNNMVGLFLKHKSYELDFKGHSSKFTSPNFLISSKKNSKNAVFEIQNDGQKPKIIEKADYITNDANRQININVGNNVNISMQDGTINIQDNNLTINSNGSVIVLADYIRLEANDIDIIEKGD